ncbi:hypothetical protein FKM82_030548 [Ascaphus truei]
MVSNISDAEQLDRPLLGHSNLSAHKNQGKRHLFEESLSLKLFECCVESWSLKGVSLSDGIQLLSIEFIILCSCIHFKV